MYVRAGVAGILRVMATREMLPRKAVTPAKAASILCKLSKWVRAPAGGLLRAFKSEGDVVEDGELLAAVSDPFGENEVELFASFDGIIIGRAVMPIVNEGDAIYHMEEDPLFDEDEII